MVVERRHIVLREKRNSFRLIDRPWQMALDSWNCDGDADLPSEFWIVT